MKAETAVARRAHYFALGKAAHKKGETIKAAPIGKGVPFGWTVSWRAGWNVSDQGGR